MILNGGASGGGRELATYNIPDSLATIRQLFDLVLDAESK